MTDTYLYRLARTIAVGIAIGGAFFLLRATLFAVLDDPFQPERMHARAIAVEASQSALTESAAVFRACLTRKGAFSPGSGFPTINWPEVLAQGSAVRVAHERLQESYAPEAAKRCFKPSCLIGQVRIRRVGLAPTGLSEGQGQLPAQDILASVQGVVSFEVVVIVKRPVEVRVVATARYRYVSDADHGVRLDPRPLATRTVWERGGP